MIGLISVLARAVALSVRGASGLADRDAAEEPPPGVVGDAAGLPSGDLEAVVASLQSRLQELPGDAPGWATLALAYVEQARESGDALRAARTEWDRRHRIHVADVLSWALHRNGQDGKALRYARLATRLGTTEGRLWIHRGTIEATPGLSDAARTHLVRGLRAHPGLSPWQVQEARTALSSLGRRP